MSVSQLPIVEQGLGTSFGSYTTAKSIINAASVVKLDPNKWYVGKKMRITALMGLSNLITAQCTFTFLVMGGPTSNIILWSSGAITTTNIAHTGVPVKCVVDLCCATVGATTTANVTAIGEITGRCFTISGNVADPTLSDCKLLLPAATMANPSSGAAGFDSTAATVIDFFCGIQTNDPGNAIRIWEYYVEDLNGP
jgi:hypothetical protein